MGKISATILGAIVGGCAATLAVILFFNWGSSLDAEPVTAAVRADYVDFLLTLVTILLAAIGLAVTVGAVVIGLVALKTLREIKDEAASEAKVAAGRTISETMRTDLEPSVAAKLGAVLPSALKAALIENELGHQILGEMAKRGELDEVLERVASRMQGGGPELEEGDEQDIG